MHIKLEEANAYADGNKLKFDELDAELEASSASQVLSRIGQVYDASTWVDEDTTPNLVRKIIAMTYVAWFYQRVYSEDEDVSNYAAWLLAQADKLTEGITSGTLVLPDVVVSPINPDQPIFYPTDASSAQRPTYADPSLGGPVFSMGRIW